jgi:hypothetical protein
VPDPDALRLVPLAFALLTVIAAYAFARLLPWRSRLEAVTAGVLTSGAVVLLPAAQLRHDLKQYTADAATAFILLALAEWAERAPTQRDRLIVFAAAGPVAFLFSSAAAMVSAAAFGGLAVAAATRRDVRGMLTRLAAGAASGATLAVLYLVLVAPIRVPALAEFWRTYYPEPAGVLTYVHEHSRLLALGSGYDRLWVWLLPIIAGVAALASLRRWATVVAILLLPVIAVVLGLLKVYPLLDARTSYFLVTLAAALGGIGVARWSSAAAAAMVSRWRPSVSVALATGLALIAVAAFAVANRSWYRYDGPTPISESDVRTQTLWVDAHRRPGDVVVLSRNALNGYLFYHDREQLRWIEAPALSTGWTTIPPDDPNVIAVDREKPEQIREAVDRAVALARANGPQARVFLVRSWWWLFGEYEAWTAALQPYQVSYPYAGPEPVAVIEP